MTNRGWITKGQIGKASACLPEASHSRAGGRLSLDATIDQLQTLRLIKSFPGRPGFFTIGKPFRIKSISFKAFRSFMELDQTLLEEFRNWLQKCFLLSWEKHTVRSSATDVVAFNESHWDIVEPAYCGLFRSRRTVFLLGEITGFRRFEQFDADATVERLMSIRRRWKTVPVSAVVVARRFSPPAWDLLRTNRVSAVTFREILGRNVESLLHFYEDLVAGQTAQENSVESLEESLRLTENTLGIEGLLGNLRGAFFELIVAMAFQLQGFETRLGKSLTDVLQDKAYEIDVVANKGEKTCLLIECKGRKKGYKESHEELQRHFEERCPVALEPFGWNVGERYERVEALFVTSGDLSSKATEYARKTTRCHGIECKTWARQKLLKFLKKSPEKRLLKLVKRYY